MVDLKTYPERGHEVQAWKEGIRRAREMARSVGITESNEDGSEYLLDTEDCPEGKQWFFRPLEYNCNKIGNALLDENDLDLNEGTNGFSLEDYLVFLLLSVGTEESKKISDCFQKLIFIIVSKKLLIVFS